jgi:hypothetical protein
VFEAGDPGTTEYEVIEVQRQQETLMEQWEKTLPIVKMESPMGKEWRDQGGRLVVPPDDKLKRKILQQLHDHWGAGHLG